MLITETGRGDPCSKCPKGPKVTIKIGLQNPYTKPSLGFMVMDCCSGHIARFHFNHFGFYTGGNTMCCLEHKTKCSKNKPVYHTNDVSVIMFGRFL